MQGGEERVGVYSAPPVPPDHSGLYGGSPGYGSTPPLAPSAPTYAQAAPSYYQPTQNSNNPSNSAYGSHLNSSFSQHVPVPSSYPNSYQNGPVHQNPPSSLFDPSSSPSSYSDNNLYSPPPPSYAPVVPSYPPEFSPHDGSFEAQPPSTSVDSTLPQDHSQYSRLGLLPQTCGGYDSYAQGESLGYSSQTEQQGYGGGAMFDQGTTRYNKSEYGLSELGNYGSRGGADQSYDCGGFLDVYAYDGGGLEAYGARRIGENSWDTGTGSTGGFNSSSGSLGSKTKITRATPKADGDAYCGGVQKFRVKMLPESRSSDSVKDVVCQIGLDGVRMVDPTTSRTLRIYPLDTITKWEVKEPSVFTFWAKSAVDVDQRMIQLKSSSYTTTAILDTLTAACVQLCEMVGKDGPSGSTTGTGTAADTSTIKKGSVLDWVALRPRPAIMEEKQHWVPDEAATKCTSCDSDFGAFLRRHHCRNCGDIFCDKCTRGRISLSTDEDSQPVRVCDRCLAEVTHRLENMTKASLKVSAPQATHEDLAKQLQEELERNQTRSKPVLTTRSGNGSSQQTSVLNCSKCGSISLVVGNSTRCSNCGADPENASSRTEKTSSFGASAGGGDPPHLWSSNTPVPDGPRPQMREVACPTCTVHLQVLVPSFGTETVECGVCQHPFLVSA